MSAIAKPGVYQLDEATYHGDTGSLSTSGAKVLLDCPAKFRWQRDHPVPPKREWDFGQAAHKLVLGEGAQIEPLDFKDYKTKAAQEAKAKAYAEGKVPILAAELERANAMAAAIRANRTAAALLNPDHGQPEQSLFWRDEPTGVMRRARLDWLPSRRIRGRLIVPDVKTIHRASLDAIQRQVWNLHYEMQADAYLEGVRALGLDEDPAFVFIFVDKEPPHVVTVVQLDAEAEAAGRLLNRKALDLYAKCVANDEWPGYSQGIEMVGLPRWAARDLEEDL